MTQADLTASRLAHYPVTYFATVMGMAGLALALHAAEAALDLTVVVSVVVYAATVALFGLVGAVYVAKALRHPAEVAAEWRHPVKLAFFPAISISLLLLSTAGLPHLPGVVRPLWLLGAGAQAVLTIAVITGWIGSRAFEHGQLSPAWFIPAVGNVVAPVGGAQLGYVELSWYFMSVGLIFWIVLLTLVFNRLVFHDPLPGRLQPTLVILIAPPAVGFTAWLNLVGEVGPVGQILINCAYFFTLIVAMQMPRILRLPFDMSFWALSFPFAAVTIASFAFAQATGSAAHRLIGTGLLAVLVVIIAALVLRTGQAIARGEVCRPD